MNVFAKFDLKFHNILRKQNVMDTQSIGLTGNVKTVYPPTNIVWDCYNYLLIIAKYPLLD